MARQNETPSLQFQWARGADPRRLARSIWRRDFLGMIGLGAALLTCYGTLLVVGLLGLLGAGIALDETIWAGAIMTFAALAAAGVALGTRRYGRIGPAVAGIAGAGIIGYALFVDYHAVIELAGFVVLAIGAGWDLRLNRRHQQRVLAHAAGPGGVR